MPGWRNCQAEIPAARATTSSSLRLSWSRAAMEPNRTAKGRICSATAGRAVEGELRHQRRRRALGVAGAAHQLDEIERVDEREDGAEHHQDRLEELGREVAPEGAADQHGSGPAQFGRRGVGGEARMSDRVGQRATWRRGAHARRPGSDQRQRDDDGDERRAIDRRSRPAGERTAALEAAKPMMRSATTATTAAATARPRPWRVVRASPSAAKAMNIMASG